jgi:hypothetical protein
MQKRILYSALPILGLATVALLNLRSLPRVQAQGLGVQQCSAAMVSGGYSYNVNGTLFSNNTLAGFYSIVGVITADGKGSVSGVDSISENGVAQTGRTYTGTYTIQPNCSGNMTLNYAGQTAPFAIAVSASGTQVAFLQTGEGAVAAGLATRQFSSLLAARP